MRLGKVAGLRSVLDRQRMEKLALGALVGALGIALAGCGSSTKRSLAVAVNPRQVALGGLISDRFLSRRRLLILTSGGSSCPAVPDKVVVVSSDTIRIHLTEGTWQRSSHRKVLSTTPPPNWICTGKQHTTPMVVTVNPKRINVERPLTIRFYYYGLVKPTTRTAPAL
jgi:hypothetical protein